VPPPPKGGRGRIVAIVLVVALIAGIFGYEYVSHLHPAAGNLNVYYTKMDGTSMATFAVSVRPPASGESAAEHRHNVALYAAVQAVAGPPGGTDAIRFPPGTRVQAVTVDGSVATVDLSREIGRAHV
jgi:hypothetical protein